MTNLDSELIKKITNVDTKASACTYSYNSCQYFLINLSNQKNIIQVTYINQSNFVSESFTGVCARDLSNLILLKYSSSLDGFHSAYLGRELMKAEISLILKQRYIQS